MIQVVRASDRHSEDPGSNPGWISMSFSPAVLLVANIIEHTCSIVVVRESVLGEFKPSALFDQLQGFTRRLCVA